jgi:hypothetical protein
MKELEEGTGCNWISTSWPKAVGRGPRGAAGRGAARRHARGHPGRLHQRTRVPQAVAERRSSVEHLAQRAVGEGQDLRRDLRPARGARELRAELAPLPRAPPPRRHLPHQEPAGRAAQLLLPPAEPRHRSWRTSIPDADLQPDRDTFRRQSASRAQGNLVPVWPSCWPTRTRRSRPMSAAHRAAPPWPASHTFLLESVEGRRAHRALFLPRRQPARGVPRHGAAVRSKCRRRVGAKRSTTSIRSTCARAWPATARARPALPRFIGGAVGFIGYDAVAQFEPRVPLSPKRDSAGPTWCS